MIERDANILSIAETDGLVAAKELRVRSALRNKAKGDKTVTDTHLNRLFDELVEAIACRRAVAGSILNVTTAAPPGRAGRNRETGRNLSE